MAGVSGVFDSGLTAPKKDKPLSFINNDFGGGLFSNIQDDGTTGNLVNKEVNNLLTGNSYDTYKSQSNQNLSRAIANLRNSVGTQYGKSVGQSSYDRAQQKTEQGIFSQIADNNLQADVEKQAMKERGITAAQSLAQAEATNKQNNMQTGMQADTQYGYLEPLTGNRVRGSNELAGTQTDIQQQQANTQRDLGYAQISSSEKISQNQLNESARQYNITNDTDKQQFAATMKLNYDQLSEQQKQFLMGFGLDQAKFTESKRQYDMTTTLEDKYRTRDLDIKEQALAQEASQFNDRLSFDRWATQAGLDDKAADRIWQATQNDKSLLNTKEIAKMQDGTQRWLQEQTDILTRTGWTVEDARQAAEHTQQVTMFNLQSALTKELESGEWKDKYGNTVQSVQLKQLAQQATQFTSAQDFEREMAKTQMLNDDGTPKYDANGNPVMVDKDLANRLFVSAERASSESWQATQRTYDANLQKELAAGQWTDEKGQVIQSAQRIQLMEQLKLAQSEVTGLYNGTETLASKNLTAQLTGMFNGTSTLSKQQLDASIGQIEAELTGTYKGADTLAKKELNQKLEQIKAELTGIYEGKDTLSKQELTTKQNQIKAELTGLYEGAETLAMKQLGLQRDALTGKIKDSAGNEVSTLEAERLAMEKKLTETQMVDPKTGQPMYNADGSKKMIDVNTARNMIETQDRIENNIHQANMQSLQNAFTEKGWGFEGIYNNIQNMEPEMAAQFIQDMAEAAGITHTIVGSNGEAIEVPGFENLSQKAYNANASLNANLDLGAIPVRVSADNVKNMTNGWDTYVEKYPNLFVSADKGLETFNTVSWNKKSDSWKISDEGNTWLNNNVGKMVKGADGNVYKVEGKGGSTDRNGTSYILLTDMATGKTVKYSRGAGGSKTFNYVQ
jgi:hypothetical protein